MEVDDVVLAELLEHLNFAHGRLLDDLVVVRLFEFLDRNCKQAKQSRLDQSPGNRTIRMRKLLTDIACLLVARHEDFTVGSFADDALELVLLHSLHI